MQIDFCSHRRYFLGKFRGRLAGKRFYLDGYYYFLQNVSKKKGYLFCTKAASLNCKSRANFILGRKPFKFVVTKKHNHPKDLIEKQCIDFMIQLKLACESGFQFTYKQIYEDVAKVYPEAARLRSFDSVRTSMSRWRRATHR